MIAQTGQSANSYIKGSIKRDMDSKGFMMNSEPMNEPNVSV